MHCSKALVIALLLGAGVACDSGRHTTAGFSLPANANLEKGKQAFSDLGCPACHRIATSNLPSPALQNVGSLVLGGEVTKKLSDAYLVTSLISPSHQLAPYSREQIATGGVSRMPDYTDKMSVRQMVDLVAYLQSSYNESPKVPLSTYR